MELKVCFFGVGSIGKRHIKNLRVLENEGIYKFQIHAFRSTKRDLELDIKLLIDKEIFEEEALEAYDILYITNPSSMHKNTINKYFSKTKNLFIEKPLFVSLDRSTKNLLKSENIYYTACPLRFNPVIEFLKNNIHPEEVISSQVLCSSYLPEWRKGIDYRNSYSAKKDMGGGVSLDLIHELDYITYLFGNPLEVINYRGKYSKLEINSDDLSLYILAYSDKLVEVHLDYFGRVSQRRIIIYTDTEVIDCDLNKLKVNYLKSGKELDFKEEDIYIKEMKYFLSHVEQNIKTFNEPEIAYRTLALTEGKIL